MRRILLSATILTNTCLSAQAAPPLCALPVPQSRQSSQSPLLVRPNLLEPPRLLPPHRHFPSARPRQHLSPYPAYLSCATSKRLAPNSSTSASPTGYTASRRRPAISS